MKRTEQRLQVTTEDTMGPDHDSAMFPNRGRSHILSSTSCFSSLYRLLSLTSGILLSIFIPYYLTFVASHPGETSAYAPFLWALSLTDLIAAGEVLIGFRTSFIKLDGSESTDPSEVAQKYLRSSFGIDCLAAIPWVLLGNVVLPLRKAAYLLSLLRVLKLVPQAWSTLESRSWQLARLAGILYLCTHWFACVWYAITEREREWAPSHDLLLGTDIFEQDAVNRYCVFWYVATTVLVQGGEFYSHTDLDTGIMIVAELAGVIGFTLIFSKVCVIVQDENQSEADIRAKLDAVESASIELNLPADLHRELISAVHKQRQATVFQSLLMLNSLQDSVFFDVILAVLPPLSSSPLSTLLASEARTSFLSLLHTQVCLPGEVLFREFEQRDAMYVVARGKLTASLACFGERLFTVHAGDVLGVQCALTTARRCCYTATADCNLLLFSVTSAQLHRLIEAEPRLRPTFEARMWEESEVWFSRCRAFIDKLPYFANLDRRDKLELALSAHIQAYEGEGRVAKKGEPLSYVVGVYAGRLAMQVRIRRKEVVIEELQAGSVYGIYTAAKATNIQTVDVIATEPTLCLLFPSDLIHQLALSLPSLSCFNSSLHDTPASDFLAFPLDPPTPNSRLRAVILRIIRGAYSRAKLTSVGLASYLLRRPVTDTVKLNKRMWEALQSLVALQESITAKLQTASAHLKPSPVPPHPPPTKSYF